MSEALLEVTTHCNSVLEEDKLGLRKELDTVKAEVWKARHYRNKPVGACFFPYIMKKVKAVFWEPVGERPKEVNRDAPCHNS